MKKERQTHPHPCDRAKALERGKHLAAHHRHRLVDCGVGRCLREQRPERAAKRAAERSPAVDVRVEPRVALRAQE